MHGCHWFIFVVFFCCCFVLALSSNEGFILNGDYVVSMFKKEIRVGNAVIEYSGSDAPVERINSTYRIDQEIVLQVRPLSSGRPNGMCAGWCC